MPSSIGVAAATASVGSRWLAGLIASLRENSPLLLLVALFMAGANGASALLGWPQLSLDRAAASYRIYLAIVFACLSAAFVLWILYVALVRKVSIQSKRFWQLTFTEFLGRDRILLALPILAAWPVMAMSFSQAKALIPAMVPFYLDPFLHAADRLIHFGQDPWTMLQPLLGHPGITYAIDRLYALWFFVVYLGLLLQMTSTRDRRLRMQFLLSSIVAWILLGSVAATLLSSVGPCYYGKMFGVPDPYAPLMTYLRETVQATSLFGLTPPPELIAVHAQDMLWGYHEQNEIGLGSGISAAPSIHVASTWLIARMLQTYGRWPAIAGWSFFGVILIGSVHLGWHYALDGYISIVSAWAIWRFTGWFLDRSATRALLWPRGLALNRA
jgi:hypothetical protein